MFFLGVLPFLIPISRKKHHTFARSSDGVVGFNVARFTAVLLNSVLVMVARALGTAKRLSGRKRARAGGPGRTEQDGVCLTPES